MERLQGREFWLDYNGKTFKVDGVKYKLRVNSFKAKYPREEGVISVYADMVDKGSSQYQDIKKELKDDWSTDVLSDPEFESDVMIALGIPAEKAYGTYEKYNNRVSNQQSKLGELLNIVEEKANYLIDIVAGYTTKKSFPDPKNNIGDDETFSYWFVNEFIPALKSTGILRYLDISTNSNDKQIEVKNKEKQDNGAISFDLYLYGSFDTEEMAYDDEKIIVSESKKMLQDAKLTKLVTVDYIEIENFYQE